MIDIASIVANLTQEQVDDWLSCRIRVSDIVKRNLLLAGLFKDQILSELRKWTAEALLRELQIRRPDIRVGNRQAALTKIRDELQTIRGLLR